MKSRLCFGIIVSLATLALLVAWKMDPSFARVPSPGKTLYAAVVAFIMASILIFSANVLLALAKGKKAKSEEELEAIMVPAMRAQQYDDRIVKWTEIPRFVISALCLGVLLAFGLHFLVR